MSCCAPEAKILPERWPRFRPAKCFFAARGMGDSTRQVELSVRACIAPPASTPSRPHWASWNGRAGARQLTSAARQRSLARRRPVVSTLDDSAIRPICSTMRRQGPGAFRNCCLRWPYPASLPATSCCFPCPSGRVRMEPRDLIPLGLGADRPARAGRGRQHLLSFGVGALRHRT